MYQPSSWNFLGLNGVEARFEDARFVVIPVPYDSTASYRPGSRDGPHRILEASRNLELFDLETADEPYRRGVFTLNEVDPVRGNVVATLDAIEGLTRDLLDRGKIPVMLGGEHTITVGAVKALPRDIVVVDLDAHADLRDSYLGDAFCHASTMRRILDQGKTVIEVGVRSMSQEEHDFIHAAKLPVYYREAIRRRSLSTVVQDLCRRVEGRQVYLSFDIDVLDPSEAPGVSTPEPDGLSFHEVQAIARGVCEVADVVAFDVVEVTPLPGSIVTEFLAAKLVYKTLGYIREI